MVRFCLSAGLVALAAILIPDVAAQCSGVTSRFTPKMGAGYKSSVIATGLRTPRGMTIDSAGNLLIAEQGSGGVKLIKLTESGDTVCVGSTKQLIASGATNHGISLSADGKTLFTSTLNSVMAYPYDASAGTVGTGKVIVTGLQNSGPHPTRTILASKANPDVLIVARGSNGNIDAQTTVQSAGRCMIKTFSISAAMTTAQNYNTNGEVLGWGLRNIVGMGEDPWGGIWSVENSMDDIRLGGKDVHNENPAEKMNYHGFINETSNKFKGKNFGYPSCVAAWDTGLLGQASLKPGDLFSPDGTPKATDCASREPARIIFPSHTAPLDIKFNAAHTAAYVAFHGSWDRSPPDGYRVMKVEFRNGEPVATRDSKTASISVMENPNNAGCPTGCFRPVNLVFDSKNRLYMTSDSSNELWVIYGDK